MPKNTHLTLSDRINIEVSLREGKSFRTIAKELGKVPSTISKEVRLHLTTTENDSTCVHQTDCSLRVKPGKPQRYLGRKPCELTKNCPSYDPILCELYKKPPYVCNGCKQRQRCGLKKRIYSAKTAQKEYETSKRESRLGFHIDPEELARIDDIISPLIKKGQSIHAICLNNADLIMRDPKTIYNYIDAGLLTAGNLDLPRKVRFRTRKKKKSVRIDKNCHLGRTYEDFVEYLEANPDIDVVEMDTVVGTKGGKVLLTLYFRTSMLMLAFIRDANTARSVSEIFNDLYRILGPNKFRELFPVILTDRGSEFTDPLSIECDENGEIRTRIFYCDPQCPSQKGSCEVAHELIRRILPKQTPFNHLQQQDILLMMSHINSYARKKIGNRSAYQLFSMLYGEDVLEKLGITAIPPNSINLTPKLLKRP